MKNRLFALTAAAVLAVSLTACGSKAEEPAAADTKTEAAEDTASADTTGEKKVLKVAMECGYAPYNWTQMDDSNGAVPISNVPGAYANGYDVMIAQRICETYGWELEIVSSAWDSLCPAVQSGTMDANIAGQSMTAERMHGCGHDGHTCIALGAAQLLLQRQNFNGTVCFVFQPAEEPGYGARAMMDDGVIERFGIEEIYGLHNMPGMKAGTIATRVGGIMASEDNFIIRIKGQGAHAARPHMAKDPLVIAAEIILALQTIVSRNVDPNVPAVISCTELHTDGIRNAIPTHVEIKGDTRSFAPEVQMLLEERMRTISEAICAMHGATCQFSYTHEFAPTVNWQQCVDVAVTAAINVVGAEKVDGNVAQMMISEDFGAFLQKIPGCFIFLGNGDSSNTPLHNACYDFNDEILLTGAEYFAEVVRTRLPQE